MATEYNPENYDPDFWQEGECGSANIVTYDGSDVRGVCYTETALVRAIIIRKHNDIVRRLKTPPVDPKWISDLKHELLFKAKATHTFTRDEVMQLLGMTLCDSRGYTQSLE